MSLESCIVDFPDFTIQGQEIQLLVETSKKTSVVVTDPNGQSCTVDIVDSGSRMNLFANRICRNTNIS
jgi:hypothetical protein